MLWPSIQDEAHSLPSPAGTLWEFLVSCVGPGAGFQSFSLRTVHVVLLLKHLHPLLQQNTNVGMNNMILKRYLAQRQMFFPTPSILGAPHGSALPLLHPGEWHIL